MERSPDSIERAVLAALTPLCALHTVLEPRGAVCPNHGRVHLAGTRYNRQRPRDLDALPECVGASVPKSSAKLRRLRSASACTRADGGDDRPCGDPRSLHRTYLRELPPTPPVSEPH
jgi:hypothetical protein